MLQYTASSCGHPEHGRLGDKHADDHIKAHTCVKGAILEVPLDSTKGSRIVRLFIIESTEAKECLPMQTKYTTSCYKIEIYFQTSAAKTHTTHAVRMCCIYVSQQLRT